MEEQALLYGQLSLAFAILSIVASVAALLLWANATPPAKPDSGPLSEKLAAQKSWAYWFCHYIEIHPQNPERAAMLADVVMNEFRRRAEP